MQRTLFLAGILAVLIVLFWKLFFSR